MSAEFDLGWLPPLVFIAAVVSAVRYIFKYKSCSDRLSAALRTLEHHFIDNYVVALIACMALLPALVQLIYSIPLCTPQVSAGEVLSFWGVTLGIIGAAALYHRQKLSESGERLNRLRPNFDLKLSPTEDKYMIKITSRSPFDYHIASICGISKEGTIAAFSSLELEISKADFNEFNSGESERLRKQGKDESMLPKTLTIELYDADGNRRTENYFYAPSGTWALTSGFFSGPGGVH